MIYYFKQNSYNQEGVEKTTHSTLLYINCPINILNYNSNNNNSWIKTYLYLKDLIIINYKKGTNVVCDKVIH